MVSSIRTQPDMILTGRVGWWSRMEMENKMDQTRDKFDEGQSKKQQPDKNHFVTKYFGNNNIDVENGS